MILKFESNFKMPIIRAALIVPPKAGPETPILNDSISVIGNSPAANFSTSMVRPLKPPVIVTPGSPLIDPTCASKMITNLDGSTLKLLFFHWIVTRTFLSGSQDGVCNLEAASPSPMVKVTAKVGPATKLPSPMMAKSFAPPPIVIGPAVTKASTFPK